MGTHLKVTSGPAIGKPGEMAAILSNLQEGDVLFVDEIHRLNRQVEEVLYPAMEDYVIVQSVWICQNLRWSVQLRERGFCQHRSVTVLAWCIIWNFIRWRN